MNDAEFQREYPPGSYRGIPLSQAIEGEQHPVWRDADSGSMLCPECRDYTVHKHDCPSRQQEPEKAPKTDQ